MKIFSHFKMIKNRKSLIMIGLVLFFNTQFLLSQKSVSYFQTECVSIENDGYTTIKIWDTKKGTHYKIDEARKDAIRSFLFSGVSSNSTCSSQSPILNNTEEQDKFTEIEKSFFSKNGKWSMFTRSSATETTLPKNLGVNNWKVYQISISKNELRKFLEEQKIIKSLNTGF